MKSTSTELTHIFSVSHDQEHEAKFEYAWFRQIKGPGKWRRLKLSTIDRIVQKEPGVAAFASIQKYASPTEKIDEVYWADLAFDFDCAENMENAQQDALTIFRFFSDFLPQEAIRLYFSGSKGFGMVIHRKTTGIIPHNKTHLYHKVIAEELVRKFKAETLDLRIYTSKRLLRLPNTRHDKSGLYKIELAPGELGLPLDQIKALAKQPRDFIFYEDELPEANEEIIKVLQDYSSRTKIIDMTELPDLSPRLKQLKEHPVCITDLLEDGIKGHTERNTATLALASYFKEKGIPVDETIKILVNWAEHIPNHLTSMAPRARRASTISCIRTVYNSRGKDYKFACPFIWNLTDIKCNKEECSIGQASLTTTEVRLDKFGVIRQGASGYELRRTITDEYGETTTVWQPQTDFFIKWDKLIETEEGEKRAIGRYICADGKKIPFEWPVALLASPNQLSAELMNKVTKSYNMIDSKDYKKFVGFFNKETPEVKGFTSIGSQKDVFVTPSFYIKNGNISNNQDFPVINPDINTYDFLNIAHSDCKEVADFIINDILDIHDRSVTVPLLGEIGRCPLIPQIGNMRYITYFEGITGAGKTIVQKAFVNFYANLSLMEKTSQEKQSICSLTDTVNRVEYHGYHLINVPLIWDDFKKRLDRSPQQTISAMQNYYNQTGRGRLTSDIKERKSYFIRANLWNNGEEIPEGHASALERCLIYRMKHNLNTKKIDHIELHRHLLRGITPHYIAWVQKNGAQAWEGNFKIEHARLVPYGRQNLTGVKTFLAFLTDNKWIERSVASEIMHQGEEAVLAAIRLTKYGSESESSSTTFIQSVREQIITGSCGLIGSPHAPSHNATIIGADKPADGEIYIFPKKTMEQISKLSGNKGNMFSTQSLGRDLLENKFIIQQRESGSPSIAKWVNGSVVNVWVFDRDKLLGKEEDIEIITNDQLFTNEGGDTT